ncbi:MAG: hypothetical protein WDO19_01805 [Bacteroidota bacterium]
MKKIILLLLLPGSLIAQKGLFTDGTDGQIEFEVDTTGKVTKAWFINTGQKGELKKIE